MNILIILSSIVFLLIGVFAFRKLWLGALGAFLITFAFTLLNNPELNTILLKLANALIIWSELILLIFGAYLFYFTLETHRHFQNFSEHISTIQSKISIALILAWYMVSFMEGVAGFGIPALLIAPLMLKAGFKPLTAITLPLAANTTSVLFGALGTALKFGLEIESPGSITNDVLILNLIPSLVLPFGLTLLLAQTENISIPWKAEWKRILGAGICFYIPFALIGIYSIEFPTILAGIVGLVAYTQLFIPKNEKIPMKIWAQTFAPYLTFIVLLLIGKYVFQTYKIVLHENLKSISFYQPGIVFFIATIVVLYSYNKKSYFLQLGPLVKQSFYKIRFSILTILLLVCFTQLVSQALSETVHSLFLAINIQWQFIVNPAMGIAGSFITGSATMSNLLLAASLTNVPVAHASILTALLHTGSAIGNAISLQNIVLAKSVIPEDISEAKILKINLPFLLAYLAIIIITAFLL